MQALVGIGALDGLDVGKCAVGIALGIHELGLFALLGLDSVLGPKNSPSFFHKYIITQPIPTLPKGKGVFPFPLERDKGRGHSRVNITVGALSALFRASS